MATVEEKRKKREEAEKKAKQSLARPPPPVSSNPFQPTEIRNQETDKLTGVKLPSGETIFGKASATSRRDLKGLSENIAAKRATPTGAVRGTAEIEEAQQGAARSELIAKQVEVLRALAAKDFTTLKPQEQQAVREAQQEGGLLSDLPFAAKAGLGAAALAVGTVAGPAAVAAGIGAAGAVALGSQVPAVATAFGKAKLAIGVISGISISKVFGAVTGGRVKDLEAQINDIRAASRDIVTSVAKGSDPLEAIELLTQMEEEMMWKIGSLNLAIDRSPIDSLTGKDTQNFAFRAVSGVVRRRQAIELFMIDGDVQALALVTGFGELEGGGLNG